MPRSLHTVVHIGAGLCPRRVAQSFRLFSRLVRQDRGKGMAADGRCAKTHWCCSSVTLRSCGTADFRSPSAADCETKCRNRDARLHRHSPHPLHGWGVAKEGCSGHRAEVCRRLPSVLVRPPSPPLAPRPACAVPLPLLVAGATCLRRAHRAPSAPRACPARRSHRF